MGIVDSLKKTYFSIEDRYYAFADAVEKTGIKMYEWFINPIEERGLPSFPFFIILVLLLLTGVYFGATMLLAGQQTSTVKITVLSAGAPVDGVQVKLFLQGSDSPLAAITANGGVVEFQAPLGGKATIRVDDSRFKPFSKQVSLEAGSSFVADLESATVASKKITVLVTNDQNQRLSDAFISFSDQDTGSSGEVFTDASGAASINFENANQIFYLTISRQGFEQGSFTCYASQNQCTVILLPISEQVPAKLFGDVRVSVSDEAGKAIEAQVTLYNDASTKISERHTANGEVFWSEIAEVGTDVYVTVKPDNSRYSTYYGGVADDVQTIRQDSPVVFNIRLTKISGTVDLNTLSIIVHDEQNTPIEGAQVSLFSTAKPERILDSQTTDENGNASFAITFGQNVYATAWADGFLPAIEKNIPGGGNMRTIKLVKLVPGNYGEARVTVKDADGNLVELAKVFLADELGFNSGLPEAETGADGTVALTGIPLQKTFKTIGVLGSLKGASDLFQADASETREVELRLERAYAYVNVSAKDLTRATNNFIVAKITAYYDNSEIASCDTKAEATNASCSLKIYANRDVVLKAQAPGFVDFESDLINVADGETKTQTILMLPENLKNQIVVTDFHLESLDGPSQILPLGNSSQDLQVERGGLYKLVLSVNIPDADKSGVFVRVGDASDAEGDVAWMESFDQPSDTTIAWGSSFDSSIACSDMQLQQDQTRVKWVEFRYPKGTVGVKTFGAVIKISNTAKKTDKLNIYNREYFVRNNVWAYNPEDADLGNTENSDSKENCFAQTDKHSLSVSEGSGKCTDQACLSVTLKSGTQTVGNALEVPLNKQFEVTAEVRSFSSTRNPYLRITTDDESGIALANARKQLDFTQSNRDSLTATGSALLPTDFAPVHVEYGDEEGVIISLERYVIVKGTEAMLLVAKPNSIEALMQTDVTVTVTTSAGTPVKDADVFIEDSPVFGNNINGDYAISGDGSRDRGADGKYKFFDLNPVSPGSFAFSASRRGFADSTTSVSVSATDFLQADFSDLEIGGTATECDSGYINVFNLLEAEIDVSASATPACVSLSETKFTLKQASNSGSSKKIRLTALKNAECVVSFNSVLSASGASSGADVRVVVNCPKLASSTSACSSSNCVACSESECNDLYSRTDANGNPYCVPDYEIIPGGTRYADCKQGQSGGAVVSPTPSTPPFNFGGQFECGTSNCLACAETQCKSLETAGYCTPLYNKPLPNEIEITDIGGARFNPTFLPVQSNGVFTVKNSGVKSHTILFDNNSNPYPILTLAPQETRTIELSKINPPVKTYVFTDQDYPSAAVAVQVQAASTTGFSYCGKLEQLPPEKLGLCSETNCVACSEAQCSNLPNNCEASYSSKEGKDVSVIDFGFTPQVITAKPGEKITWKDNGISSHHVVFDNYPELDTGVFTAGQSVSLSITEEGTYNYKDVLYPDSMFGRVMVKSTTGKNFATCLPKTTKNETTSTSDSCAYSKFDFASILARRLGQYHANQLFNPSTAGKTAAASASNKIVLTAYGWQVGAVGAGCTTDGVSEIRCEKPVNALVPRNGIAFSVQSKLGMETTIDNAFAEGKRSCFKVTNVEQRTDFDQFVQGLRDFTTGALGLPQNQYRTYVVIYDSTQPGCAEWTADENGVHLNPGSSGKAAFTLSSTSLFGSGSSQFRVYFTATQGDDTEFSQLAFIASPNSQITYRTAVASPTPTPTGTPKPSPTPTTQEPYVFANNLPATVSLNVPVATALPSFSSAMANARITNNYTFSIGSSTKVERVIGDPVKKTVSVDLAKYDVVGNAGTEDGVLGCSGTEYCDETQAITSIVEVQSALSNAYSEIYSSMDTVQFTGAIDGSATVFQKALDDAVRDYEAALQTYAACKALGTDPIEDLRARCASQYYDPTSLTGGINQWGSIYGDAFTQTACDSETFNYAQGLYGGYGQQSFWNTYKQRLLGQIQPASGRMNYGKPIIPLEQVAINVPIKIAGANGGTFLASFKTNAGKYGTLSEDTYSNTDLSDFFGSGDFTSGELTTIHGDLGPDLLAKLLPKLKKGYASTDGALSIKPIAPYYYLDSTGKAITAGTTALTGNTNTPNLFTINKYGLQVQDAEGKGKTVSEILAGLPNYQPAKGASDESKQLKVYGCIPFATESDCGFPTGLVFEKPEGTFVSIQLSGYDLMLASNIVPPETGEAKLKAETILGELLSLLLDEAHQFNKENLQGCNATEYSTTKITVICSNQEGATQLQTPPATGWKPPSGDSTSILKDAAGVFIFVPAPGYKNMLSFRITTDNDGKFLSKTYPTAAQFTRLGFTLFQGDSTSGSYLTATACASGCDFVLSGFGLINGDWTIQDLSKLGITKKVSGNKIILSKGGKSITIIKGGKITAKVFGKWEKEVPATVSPTGKTIAKDAFVWGMGAFILNS